MIANWSGKTLVAIPCCETRREVTKGDNNDRKDDLGTDLVVV
jgi:hypothetical protein